MARPAARAFPPLVLIFVVGFREQRSDLSGENIAKISNGRVSVSVAEPPPLAIDDCRVPLNPFPGGGRRPLHIFLPQFDPVLRMKYAIYRWSELCQRCEDDNHRESRRWNRALTMRELRPGILHWEHRTRKAFRRSSRFSGSLLRRANESEERRSFTLTLIRLIVRRRTNPGHLPS